MGLMRLELCLISEDLVDRFRNLLHDLCNLDKVVKSASWQCTFSVAT